MKKMKCSFCENKLPKKYHKVFYESDVGNVDTSFYSLACDDCANILEIMKEKMEEVLDGEYESF
jgi:hypothetical protein